MNNIFEFLAHCGITAISLWIASLIFHGIKFTNKVSLSYSAVLLGIANAIIKPVVILLTIPLTLISFGFFLLVINALMMLLVSTLVPGFKISGFWTAFFASIFITVLSFFAGIFIFQTAGHPIEMPAQHRLII
jgi:putative membrane protein